MEAENVFWRQTANKRKEKKKKKAVFSFLQRTKDKQKVIVSPTNQTFSS
jgi:hypothetical protein